MHTTNPVHSLDPFLPPKTPREKSLQQWAMLPGASSALALCQLVAQQEVPVIVLTKDTATSVRLERECHFFAKGAFEVLQFPDWETLPYDNFSPHQDIISERLRTLWSLEHLTKGLVVVPISTLMHRVVPRSYIAHYCFQVRSGQTLSLETFRDQLIRNGYRLVSQVMEHGECSVRGAIIDVFPMGSSYPLRLDFLADELDSIRTFDPQTQRSLDTITEISLLPARECPIQPESIALFRSQWRSVFSGDTKSFIYQQISRGLAVSGIEYYLPLFFEKTSTLFDFFPENSVVVRFPEIEKAAEHFFEEVKIRFEERRYDLERPVLEPTQLFLRADEVFHNIKHFPRIQIDATLPNAKVSSLPDLALDPRSNQPFAKMLQYQEQEQCRILLCAESLGRKEILLELLNRHHIHPFLVDHCEQFLEKDVPFGLMVGGLETGFAFLTPEGTKIALLTESQLFGHTVLQRRRRKTRKAEDTEDQSIAHLAELKIGDAVVHIDYGVGRYQGLVNLEIGDVQNEFVMLEYAGHDKLYVPVSGLQVLSRYSAGDSALAPLNKLGTDQWEKAKKKALEQVKDVAAELLAVYAQRKAFQGFSFKAPDEQYEAFSHSFAFELTEDQEKAIQAVCQDMQAEKPMDRLICGDVGFGKTEVAMRAAFLAVQNGKQVAVLVPTTLLAQQHFETFKDRFAGWPISIDMISRFRTKTEQTLTLKGVQNGNIDILIGTHKLLSSELKFRDLGLVVIDEEHRFGVEHKEKLKALRSSVDILTLTATPIPRTLNMALSAIRDLSIIATPPAKRLSIKTFVREYHKPLIREAILRELLRGGQVYYLHNMVETIHRAAESIQELIPEAKVHIAHGQMRERELEQVMSDFYHQRSNILVCTTIIETGIDVPNANTMIIERADTLGLAQLHQLRGRVGRSHHQAYAYLLTPKDGKVTGDALKRLEAIAAFEDLGAGFALASQDLEIRGAGELLGDKQSGDLQAIGYTLYMELLDRTVKALKSGKTITTDFKAFRQNCEINVQSPALIPEHYLPDVHSRLVLYKRIASSGSLAQLEDLQAEMIDRFGVLPESTRTLFQVSALRLSLEPLGVKKCDLHASGGRLEFLQDTPLDPTCIISLIQKQPKVYQFQPPNVLRFKQDLQDLNARFEAGHTLAHLLKGTSASL